MPPKVDLEKNFKNITICLIVLGVLLIGSNLFLYFYLTNDYDTKFQQADIKLQVTKDALTEDLDQEAQIRARDVENLEVSTANNFKQLQDYFTSENTKLKLDVETVRAETDAELNQINEQVDVLEDKSVELADQISEIDVSSSDFSSIVNEVIKAVVSIKTNTGQGSGVLFSEQGYVMTNKHVIEGATAVSAVTHDGVNHPVQLIGMANNADLAVIKILTEQDFDYLRWGNSDSVQIGERVIAVGNPLGLSFSVTEGIISAKDRSIDSTGVPFIQTDVPINPGNSGGPLITANKRIIGINTFKIGETEGLGFAIPSNIAEDIAGQAVP